MLTIDSLSRIDNERVPQSFMSSTPKTIVKRYNICFKTTVKYEMCEEGYSVQNMNYNAAHTQYSKCTTVFSHNKRITFTSMNSHVSCKIISSLKVNPVEKPQTLNKWTLFLSNNDRRTRQVGYCVIGLWLNWNYVCFFK